MGIVHALAKMISYDRTRMSESILSELRVSEQRLGNWRNNVFQPPNSKQFL